MKRAVFFELERHLVGVGVKGRPDCFAASVDAAQAAALEDAEALPKAYRPENRGAR